MFCPFCQAEDTKVIDSRLVADGSQIRRRRSCEVCHSRFTTFETADLALPRVIKTNGEKIYKVQAVYYILKKIDRYFIVRILLKLLPLFLTNICYDLIANFRYRIFGKYETCIIPNENVRKNFIN